MILERSGEWTGATWDGSVVTCTDVQVGIVLEQEWPRGGVEFGCVVGWCNHHGRRGHFGDDVAYSARLR